MFVAVYLRLFWVFFIVSKGVLVANPLSVPFQVRRGQQAEGTFGESMGGTQADVAFRVRVDGRLCWAVAHDRAYHGDLRSETP